MNSIQSLNNLATTLTPANTTSAVEKSTSAFGDMLKNMVSETNKAQSVGDNAVANLEAGKAEHLHEVMIAVEEAEMSLKMLVQMRNKALTAYEEIMRMQI
jgi:flagellar hook-basal body complex protein FliE